jgi:hypothetical protein
MLGPPKLRCLDRPVAVSLEQLVPADHFYRHLDATLDLSFVREWVKGCYADCGRASIDPIVFFRATTSVEAPKRWDLLEECRLDPGRPASGDYQRLSDQRISRTDPDAALMRAKSVAPLQLGFHDHYVVDGGKARIILQALVTPADVMENQPMLDLLRRVVFRWHLQPGQVVADTTYGTIENIVALGRWHPGLCPPSGLRGPHAFLWRLPVHL